MEDRELINAALKGDDQSFRRLVEKYESLVASTVIGMIGPGPEADDVGQETFIRLYQHLDKFRGDAKLSTFITRIAINLSLNAIKRRKRSRLRFISIQQESAPDIPDTAHHGYHEEKELVNRAIQQLTPQFRSVVLLRLIEGYSTSETAEILQIPIGTVLSRLKRAQNKLKTILEPYYGVQYEKKYPRPVAQVV